MDEDAVIEDLSAASIAVMAVDAAVFGGRCMLRWEMLRDADRRGWPEPEIGEKTRALLAALPDQ